MEKEQTEHSVSAADQQVEEKKGRQKPSDSLQSRTPNNQESAHQASLLKVPPPPNCTLDQAFDTGTCGDYSRLKLWQQTGRSINFSHLLVSVFINVTV